MPKNKKKKRKKLLRWADEVEEGEIVSKESHLDIEAQYPDAANNNGDNNTTKSRKKANLLQKQKLRIPQLLKKRQYQKPQFGKSNRKAQRCR